MKKAKKMKKCEVVFKHDVKCVSFTLYDLLTWIHDSVPAGIRAEDIYLEVVVDQSADYYDQVIVDAELQISVEK